MTHHHHETKQNSPRNILENAWDGVICPIYGIATGLRLGQEFCSPGPILVRVEDGGLGLRLHGHKVGLEEFADLSINPQTVVHKQDEGFVVLSSPPPLPSSAIVGGTAIEFSENPSRVFSHDDRSNHGVKIRFRKPLLPLQLVQCTVR